MQVLLSHDAWEPVVGREMLWREHRLLLLAQPLLRSYLVPPADISESAAYWEPPPCALCGRAVWPDSASGCYMHWCDRCAKADSEQTERRTRQEQEWRRQEYQRRMREKRRCYGADPGHVRKSGAPPSAYNSAMPPPAFYLRRRALCGPHVCAQDPAEKRSHVARNQAARLARALQRVRRVLHSASVS